MVKKKKSTYDIPLEDLLKAGCHFGHQSKRWNPKMVSYIWQARKGIHIFDLPKTAERLKEACLAMRDLAKEGKSIIFIGTKRQASAVIKEEAKKAGVFYVSNRWLGGTITNWQQIKKSIDSLIEMKEGKEKGEYKKYTKKENVLIDRKINRLTRFFEGLETLKGAPDAMFVVDVKREIAAIKEARMKGIKIFAIVDSNSDPTLVDYVIPANDDAVQSIKLIVSQMAQAVIDGKEMKK